MRLERALYPLATLLPACSGVQSSLNPAGPHADLVAALWWVALAVGTAVTLLVIGLLVFAIAGKDPSRRPLSQSQSRNLVIAGGVLLPMAVIIPFALSSFSIGQTVDGPPPEDALSIEVVGRLWWWELHYLDDRGERIATTANEIHVPVGRPVRFVLRSDNVIHSFWVPNLQGKKDLIPGSVNVSWLEADRPGVYRGQCAEYCGKQHGLMAFAVIAEPPRAFQQWLQRQSRDAPEPRTQQETRGHTVFMRECAECHTVRGTAATGTDGPDLTHVADRRTLAAGTIPNRPGHLAGWIADPQRIKPGSKMPATALSPADLKALLAYLESLQ